MKIAVRASRTMTRRRMLETLGAIGVAAASGVLTAPRPARAQQLGLHESVDGALKRVFGSRPIRDGAGRRGCRDCRFQRLVPSIVS